MPEAFSTSDRPNGAQAPGRENVQEIDKSGPEQPGSGSEPEHLCVVMPVFDDWSAANNLIRILDEVLIEKGLVGTILAIDDGSVVPGSAQPPKPIRGGVHSVHTIRLRRNVGHQRAIAIGLCIAATKFPGEDVVVMDADGEDKPADLVALHDASRRTPGIIVFANRAKRSESLGFRVGYHIYKLLFVALTGRKISFGNFCLVPGAIVGRVVFFSEIWNHFSAGVLKARVAYTTVRTERGRRLSGESRMNFVSLTIHGLSAISVHVDVVAARVLIASLGLMTAALCGIAIVSGIRLFTTLAIPGWASATVAGLAIIFLQACGMSLLLGFSMLHYRMQPEFIPGRDFRVYVESVLPEL